jgi:hypothetical protein
MHEFVDLLGSPGRPEGSMGEIVNLRRAKKQRARTEADAAAQAARAKHGETKAGRDRRAAEIAAETRKLDQAKIENR